MIRRGCWRKLVIVPGEYNGEKCIGRDRINDDDRWGHPALPHSQII